MTNKEKYMDKIIDAVINKKVRIIAINKYSNEIKECCDVPCNECDLQDITNKCGSDCSIAYGKWLDDKFCEQKKKHRANYDEGRILKFAKMNSYKYIARDKTGDLFFYKEKPNKVASGWFSESEALVIDKDMFSMISYEDEEPYEIDNFR